ncbi:hypothetical protein V9T40_000694 [Parthenolecanium corni]|uniref:Ion transport N-terminal domain-containing protein n=1 Tax=Parthenolecanium corni TaxID=536013 RepID=A0AAN9TA98_9HEMI
MERIAGAIVSCNVDFGHRRLSQLEEQSHFGAAGASGHGGGGGSTPIAAELQRALAHKLTNVSHPSATNNLKNGGGGGVGPNIQPAAQSHGGSTDSRRHSRTHSVEELQRLGLGSFALAANRDLCSRGSGGSGGSAGGAAGGGCGSGGSSIGGGYGVCCYGGSSVDRDSVKISLENTNTCTDSLVTAIDDEAFLLSDFLPHDNDASFGGGSVLNYRCGGGGVNFAGACGCSGASGGGGVGCGGGGKVHFGGGGGGDDLSLYGTPKEELGPIAPMGNHNGPSGGGGGNGYGGGRGSVGGSGANVSTSMGAGGNAGGAAAGAAGESGKQSFIKNQLQALFQPTDNKLAMKLFGSKKALMKERIRQKETGHWVIHPCSSFR